MFKSEIDSAAYFQHSADLRNDIRVRAVRRKFGNEGYAVMNYLFELMTEKPEFKLEFSPIDRELLAADFEVDTEWLNDFVFYCEEVQLFNINIDENTLSSDFLKEVFRPLLELRARRAEAGRKGGFARKRTDATQSQAMPSNATQTQALPSSRVENSRVEDRIGEDIELTKEEIKEDKQSQAMPSNATQTQALPSSRVENSRVEDRIGEDIELTKEEIKEDNSLDANASTSSEKTDDAQSFNKKGFIEFFNKTMKEAGASIPRIESIKGRREAAIKARIREFGKVKVMRAIEIAAKSQFLNGGGERAFIASLDWIMRPNNFPKVVEGNYNNNNTHANGDCKPNNNRRRGVEVTATCAEDYLNSTF